MNNSLKFMACCLVAFSANPAFAKETVKQAVAHTDEWKRHRAIEESIGRMQLNDLIASIVDTDGKHPIQTQRASRTTSSPAS